MALPPLAEVSDLAAWVGQAISPDDLRAGAVLSAASALVRNYTGLTWVDEADSLTDVPEVVSAVVVQVAARVWRNPSGAVAWTKGPFSERYSDEATSGLYLTEGDRAALDEFRETPSGLGTLGISRDPLGVGTDVYVPTGPPPSGYPFPWYDASEGW